MQVKEAMHRGAEWMEPTASLVEISRRMRDEDIGSIPIGENDRLVGMVTDRDIVVKALADGADVQNKTARDVMTEGIVYCHDDAELDEAIRIMEDSKIRRLPVIDGNKRLVGILSLGDISDAAGREQTGNLASAVAQHHGG
jgi:CBS domain-containing protein